MRLLAALLFVCAATGAAGTPASEARALLKRILPTGRDAEFTIAIDETAGDSYTIADDGEGKVKLTGNTAGSVASALNWYLKYVAFCQVSWAGDNLKLASPLPKVGTPITKTRNYKYGYMANVCTVSYTYAWFDWARWEREIDWMAMNGINMPLAFTGQEYVWNATYAEFGVTYADLQDFFAGPAFLAWQRMGNIQAWGGPLPEDFVFSQKDLQIRILSRQRALGMTPVLPAFAGFVPPAFVKKHPGAHYRGAGVWNGFAGKYGNVTALDPTDPLYKEVATAFIKKQMETYGTDSLYNADQFNEMAPLSGDPQYLADASLNLYEGMRAADPNATWVMQGWLFVNERAFWTPGRIEAYLDSVPNDRMIILDLTSENDPQFQRTQSYYGKPFIWNMLLNYGGNTGLYGEMDAINNAPYKNATNTTIIGFGITPEGTLQNYPVYDLMLETIWRKGPVDLDQWYTDYAHRRYGADKPGAAGAWKLVGKSAFSSRPGQQKGATKNKMVLRPGLQMNHDGFMPTNIYYNASSIVAAMKMMLQEAGSVPNSITYDHDIVDITRQAMSNLFYELHSKTIQAYDKRDANGVYRYANETVDMIKDMDSLLSSNTDFLLGTWLEAAKALGNDNSSKAYYEWNARNQITLWGPDGQINDYASKEWGGLVADYYLPRWELFWSRLGAAAAANTTFDEGAFAKDCLELEKTWQNKRNTFPTTAKGESIGIATVIATKYFPEVDY